MKKLKRTEVINRWQLYSPIYVPCILAFGWLIVSLFKDYWFITLYPIYCAEVLASFALFKYRERDRYNIPIEAAKLDIKIFLPIAICGIIITTILLFFKILIFPFSMAIYLLMITFLMQVKFNLDTLKQRKTDS